MKKYLLAFAAMLFTVTGMAQQDYQNPPSSMSSLRSNQGKLYTFKVTGKVNGRVWGGRNNIYTDNSDLATAAVHSGYVKIGETKLLKVRIINDVKDYPSISRNGINSMKCDTWAGAFHIQSSQTMLKEEPRKFKERDEKPSFIGGRPQTRNHNGWDLDGNRHHHDKDDKFRSRQNDEKNRDRFGDKKREQTKQNNGNMTNKERADVLYRLLRNNMSQMPEGTMYHAGNKTTVRAAIINRRPVTNREYAAATDVWLNRNAPDAPAKVNGSQRNLFIKCMDQAFGRTNLFRVATSDEMAYGERNNYIKNTGSSYIYFIYRDNWEKYIKNKQYLNIFGFKM